MKSNRFEFAKHILLLAVGLCFLAGGTNTQAADSKLRPGLIVVAKVEGTVQAVDPQGKTTQQLKKSDTLSEKYTVKVGADSSATLAFSNGAVISLSENTTMVISEFLQDPFAPPFASEEDVQEPTTSVTKLQLVQGDLVATVKKLRIDQGSSMVVNTPVGAAGVRGTTLRVSYKPGGGYVVSCTEGSVEFTDGKGTKIVLKAGEKVEFNANGIPTKKRMSPDEIEEAGGIAKRGKKAITWIFADATQDELQKQWSAFATQHNIIVNPITPTNPSRRPKPKPTKLR